MPVKVEFSLRAKQDLSRTWDYLAGEFSISSADRWQSGILDSVEILSTFLDMGKVLESPFGKGEDYRCIVTGSYLAFYRHHEDAVTVYRILHGGSDYLRALFADDN